MSVNWTAVRPRPVTATARANAPAQAPAAKPSAAKLPEAPIAHLWRPLRGALLFARGLVGKVTALFRPGFKPQDAASPDGRARETWAALQAKMGLAPGAGVYAEHAGGSITATVWPYGQALAAALDLAKLDGNYDQVKALAKGLSNFKKDGAYAPGPWGGKRLWDDNAWVGLDLIQAYGQTKDPAYLDQAEALFPFFLAGLAKQGGVYWEENNPRMSLNACANGPAAEYALRLYMITKKPQYLAYAKNLDGALNGPLRSPEGMYYDNVGDDGTVGKEFYSYNQGAALGADVLWYKVTRDKKYLDRAQQTAKAALKHFGKGDRLWKQAPSFNAIFFRNLLTLDAVAPDPAYRKALDAYLDRAWKEGRDPKTGLFTQGGMGSYTAGKADMLDQAGLTQLFALAAWPKDKLADVS
ncbi:MAG: glycoside hydrolase family 76 [Cyanobacteria bacterium RYN_339]|nr:glycoside hydrolase family 76 [Cyanobacteria bacterium RYN_339]